MPRGGEEASLENKGKRAPETNQQKKARLVTEKSDKPLILDSCMPLTLTKPEQDFCQTVEKVINTDPNGTWIFVCDGLNTHKSEALVQFIAQACGLEDELGKKRKNQHTEKQDKPGAFLHNSAHRIRLVYTPKHSSWMIQIEIWFGIINRKLLKRKNYLSIEELEESIRKLIRQYNLTAHPLKWTYARMPLTI